MKSFNAFAVRTSGLALISRTRLDDKVSWVSFVFTAKGQVLREIIKDNNGRKTNTLEWENLISEAVFVVGIKEWRIKRITPFKGSPPP